VSGRPPALVIGFAIHGLAVARALARSGVQVYVLSEDSTPVPPAALTRYARVFSRRGLNSEALPAILMALAAELRSERKIVLFPTSDRIAKSIALAWPQLSEHYALSWAHCRDLVLQLQRKDVLAQYCDRAGVRYPKSRNLAAAQECTAIASELSFPLVVKPAMPLSAFKAIRVANIDELRRCVTTYPRELPFVVQEWVEGPEPSLYACTTLMNQGKVTTLFTSRKLDASPPGLGQGTVFETLDCPEIADITRRFLETLDLSGPVAVEFKRDAAGKYWLIEPNVGRTEYCVDLAVQSGFNLPYVEYLHVIGKADEVPAHASHPRVWFDTDKDPTCFVRNATRLFGQGRLRRPIFPFLGHDDGRPLAAALAGRVRWALRATGRRVFGMKRPA
jgi:predicted ATP-grasp superfamily ATP-dependent carboligase